MAKEEHFCTNERWELWLYERRLKGGMVPKVKNMEINQALWHILVIPEPWEAEAGES